MDLPTTFRRVADSLPRPSLPLLRSKQGVRELDADLYETDDAYLAVFDAPGANQSDVQLRFADGAIHVRIDRFRDVYPEYESRVAGRPMSADGRVDLPPGATVAAAEADAALTTEGTLRVRMPKDGAVPDPEAAGSE